MGKQKQQQLTHNAVYLPHEHTPQMHRLFLRGIAALNDIITEIELNKRREAEEEKQAASSG